MQVRKNRGDGPDGHLDLFVGEGSEVLVVGGGKSGMEACLLALDLGASVTLFDEEGSIFSAPAWKGIEKRGGRALSGRPLGRWILETGSRVIVSPGVPPVKWSGEIVATPRQSVRGELEWAASLWNLPMIAIGGTNGKSTTTALLAHLVAEMGLRPFVGGNFGTPLSAGVREVLGAGKEGRISPYDIGIIEVSSFQTESMQAFDPLLYLLLNITPDHLDRYGDYSLYREAKLHPLSRFSEKTTVIWNGDQDDFREGMKRGRARPAFVTRAREDSGLSGHPVLAIERGAVRGREIPGVEGEIVIDTRPYRLVGGGNEENLAFAILALLLAGGAPGSRPDLSRIEHSIGTFPGLPHRMEVVETVRGVTFVNDSKATNVGAVESALSGLPEHPHPWIILILGGRDKGGSYLPLVPGIRKHVREVVTLGEARKKIHHELSPHVTVEEAGDFFEAVARAFSMADDGEMVLLSPACSSYDMFHGYEERGERFREAVRRLREQFGGERKENGTGRKNG